MDWVCPKCEQRIHSLDGAISSNGGPFRHFDCEEAASIDYKAAFDRLYEAMLDIGYTSHALVEETMDDGLRPEIERLICSLWIAPGEATSHVWLKTGEQQLVPTTNRRDGR